MHLPTSRPVPRPLRIAGLGFLLLLSALPLAAQTGAAPPRTLVRDVRLAADAEPVSLLLSQGHIEGVLDATAPTPPAVREVDGQGLMALPAFIDATSSTGCATPEPKVDQDRPLKENRDVRIDMRRANRKGIQPAFRAVDVLAIEEAVAEHYREAGFGTLLSAPGGELLAGTSALVATREAAARDLVVEPAVFAHAAFQASGGGYPSTLMGYHAQLRQFFLDCAHHARLEQRYEQGRPGVRPPYDLELDAGRAILDGELLLVCEAESARDVERWIKLADEFGFRIAISGGREAWKLADTLAARQIPVLLTLDWGDEVEDPEAAGKSEEETPAPEAEAPAEGEPPQASPAAGAEPEQEPESAAEAEPEPAQEPEPAAESAQEPAAEPAEPEIPEQYLEPLRVRVERRRLWEEGRDCAIRLHEAGVRFAFGTADEKPDELLDHVRELIEAGLDRDAAIAALTTTAAELMGVESRLGRIAPGYDATFALWTKDPADEKAKVARIFVDGFTQEFDVEAEDESPPAEGVDVTGTWALVFPDAEEGAPDSATLEITMEEDGTVEGTLTAVVPDLAEPIVTELEGRLAGTTLTLEGRVELGPGMPSLGLSIELEVDEDAVEGQVTTSQGGELDTSAVKGKRESAGPGRGRQPRRRREEVR